MKYILDHQSAFENGHDIMVVDNTINEYVGSIEQQEAIGVLNNKEHKTNYSMMKVLVNGCSNSLSIKVGKNTGDVYISSLFLTKDDKGRRIPYSFWSKHGNSSAETAKTLENAAVIADMQLNPKDIEAVDKALHFYPKVKNGIIGGIVLISIILLITII